MASSLGLPLPRPELGVEAVVWYLRAALPACAEAGQGQHCGEARSGPGLLWR